MPGSECVSIRRGYIVKPRRMKMNDVDERLEWTREGLGMAAKLCGVAWAPNERGKLGKSCIFPMRIGRCTETCAICWWDEFPNNTRIPPTFAASLRIMLGGFTCAQRASQTFAHDTKDNTHQHHIQHCYHCIDSSVISA